MQWRSPYKKDHRGTKWLVLDPTVRLPDLPACYAIYIHGMLSYIGQSSNLRDRFKSHNIRIGYGGDYLTPWGDFESVYIKAHFGVRFGDWLSREVRLIRRVRPQLNKQHARS